MSARIWSSPDSFDGTPDDRRPTLRLDLEAYRRRRARLPEHRRSSGLFNVKALTAPEGAPR